MNRLGLLRLLWAATSILALVAAVTGIVSPTIYDELAPPDLLAGMLSQDLFTVLAAVVALALVVRRADNAKAQVVLLSIMGYFFYAYAIYAMERMYNALYFVYLGVLGLAFYSIVYTLVCLDRDRLARLRMERAPRLAAAAALVVVALLFYALWAAQLLPLMRAHERLEYRYSIFILDCALLLPALLITAAKLVRGEALGALLAPAIFLKGFTLLFSVGLASILLPLQGLAPTWGEMGFYLGMATFLGALGVLTLSAWRTAPGSADSPAGAASAPPPRG